MQFRFQQHRRLKKNTDFRSVLDKSYRASHKYLVALYQPNAKINARLGVSVGKRVAKEAVIRNQIKRVIRESFRLNQHKLANLDIVIIVRPECRKADKKAWRETIDKLWPKLIVPSQPS